jgi:hypothetical protein
VICALLPDTAPERKAAGYAGLVFGILYGGFITAVYFIQLTTVYYKSASTDILDMLSYEALGSLMFNLDLLGYGLMALSTFFIGLSQYGLDKTDKILRKMLMIHGVFTIFCVLAPIFNIFNQQMGETGDTIRSIALLFWCLYFLPIALLLVQRFHIRTNNK